MNIYAIRQAIIRAMHRFANPQNFETILGSRELILAAGKITFTNDDVRIFRREWNFLIEQGYLQRIRGWDDYARLSGDVRSRLDAVDPLTGSNPFAEDELICGPDALR